MQAIVIDQFGPPSVFKEKNLSKPPLQNGHLLVEVKATSVNPIDAKIRSGAIAELAPLFPAVLHGDVAGIVSAVGPGVVHFQKGDEIYACAGGVKGTGGALAEFMLIDADCAAKKPKSLSFAQAAALPLVTITAWTALFLRAQIKPGQSLLIHGGVGGVGHIAIQLAKWKGAKIATTVGAEEDFVLARQFGAHEIIHFRKESVPEYVKRVTADEGFQVIFDTVGGKNLSISFQAAALNGTIVTTAARSTNDLTLLHQKGLTLHAIFMLIPLLYNRDRKHQGEILAKATQLIDEGKLSPLIDPHPFSFSEVSKAHEYWESGQAKGKIVLYRS